MIGGLGRHLHKSNTCYSGLLLLIRRAWQPLSHTIMSPWLQSSNSLTQVVKPKLFKFMLALCHSQTLQASSQLDPLVNLLHFFAEWVMASPDSVVEFRLLRNFEAEQGNMLFEKALAECNKDTQDRWCNVANKVVAGWKISWGIREAPWESGAGSTQLHGHWKQC